MKRIWTALALLTVLSGPAYVYAQNDASPSAEVATDAAEAPAVDAAPATNEAPAPTVEPGDTGGILDGMFDAMRGGDWLVAIGFGLFLLVAGIRWFLGGVVKWAWANTKMGGLVIAFALAFLTAVGGPLSMGEPFSFGLIGTALVAAWTGAGIHGHQKDARGK